MTVRRTDSGFTLIEVLIAIAIAAIVLGVVYGSYSACTQSVRVHRTRLECHQRAWSVLQWMSEDLRSACVLVSARGDRDEATPGGSLVKKEAGPPAFVARPDASHGPELLFVCSRESEVPAGRSPAPTLSVVGYRLDEARNVLLRRQCSAFEDDAFKRDDWRVLLRDVSALACGFSDGRDWRDEWNSDERGGLPRAVRIQLSVFDGQARDFSFATGVALPTSHGAKRERAMAE